MGSRLTRYDHNEIREILGEKFDYYNRLSVEGKKKFFSRLIHFVQSKRFFGKEGLDITTEIIVLVGASAIQLTFGLNKYRIAHFKNILMFPSTFHFRLINKDLKGGASPKGTLWLSWESFQHGYEVPDDKRNLGLHELSHALKLDVLGGYDFDEKFASYYAKWDQVSNTEFKKLKGGGVSFFRKYAGTNKMEFFAVAVEHFFEAPEAFQKELPDIYNHLCVLLNQNPINESGDFELTPEFIKKANLTRRKFPLPEKIKLSYEYHYFHWSYPLTAFAPIFGWSITKAYFDETLIGTSELATIIGVLTVIGGILQYPSLVRTKVWTYWYPMYLFFGLAPMVGAGFLLFNFHVPISESRREVMTEVHEVIGGKIIKDASLYILRDNAFRDHEEFRSFHGRYDLFPTKVTHIQFSFRNGFLGYRIIGARELLRTSKEEPI